MSRVCDVCGKGRQIGHKISHSNIKTKTEWMVNVQKVRAYVDGRPQRVTACTRCIRGGKIVKRVHQ